MRWFKDEYEESYDELCYGSDEEEEQEETGEEYFDTPLPYRK